MTSTLRVECRLIIIFDESRCEVGDVETGGATLGKKEMTCLLSDSIGCRDSIYTVL